MKQPAIQFYVGDWKKDPTVSCLSYAARGLWFEMLLLMHESPRRGYLLLDSGEPMSVQQLARCTGGTVRIVTRLLAELEHAGTFRRDPLPVAFVQQNDAERGFVNSSSAILCRRMVRDEEISQIRKIAGSKGGNPVLLVGTLVNQTANQNGGSSSSSSSSVLERVHSNQTNTSPKCISPDTDSEPTKPAKPTTRTHQNGHSERDRWFMELFWPVVWAKIGKDAALKAWRVKIGTREQCDKAVAAAVAQGPAILERGARSGSVLHPATWLNGGRMDDEEPELPTVTRKRNGSEPAWVALAAQGKLPC